MKLNITYTLIISVMITNWTISGSLENFTGQPLKLPAQKLWEKRGGWGGIITAMDGTLIAFQSPGGTTCKRSIDGGNTWGSEIMIAPDAKGGNAIIDETSGDLLFVSPDQGWIYRSKDIGLAWQHETCQLLPDGFGLVPGNEGVAAMQPGITLAFGKHKGRLLTPARIMSAQNSNDVKWRPYHYSTALFSDDQGKTWQTTAPFPVLGTGEGAIAELSDGSILYNSREHMSPGNRFFAWSYNGGELWLNASRNQELPDGPQGSSYGCCGGMIRLPIKGHDILIYSNLDSLTGTKPKQTGGSTSAGRERISVWASFDGGKSWPHKKLIYAGPSAYSTLAAGRPGTPSAGRIFLIYEGGEQSSYEAVYVTAFNLSWLLDCQDINRDVN